MGIINLNLSPQHSGFFVLGDGPQDLVVEQPAGVVGDTQMAALLKQEDPRLPLGGSLRLSSGQSDQGPECQRDSGSLVASMIVPGMSVA